MERPGDHSKVNPTIVKLQQAINHEKATESILKYDQALIDKVDKILTQ